MTNKIEQMQKYATKATEFTSLHSRLAIDISKVVREESERIRLTDVGDKFYAKKKMEKSYLRDVAQILKKAHEDYRKLGDTATRFAREILVEEPPKPDDLHVKEFEKALSSLQTKATLKINAEQLERELGDLLKKYPEPYFAKQAYDNFSGLMNGVLANDSDPTARRRLSVVYDHLAGRALTEEQQAASEIMGMFKNYETRNLLPKGLTSTQALARNLGIREDSFSNIDRLVDKAEQGFAEIEAQERANIERTAERRTSFSKAYTYTATDGE